MDNSILINNLNTEINGINNELDNTVDTISSIQNNLTLLQDNLNLLIIDMSNNGNIKTYIEDLSNNIQ